MKPAVPARPTPTRPRAPTLPVRAMASPSPSPTTVDVAIVGGGPCGLATAVGIARAAPDLRVAVLERADQLRPVGFTIGLLGA